MNLAHNIIRVLALLMLATALIYGTGCEPEESRQQQTPDPAAADLDEPAEHAPDEPPQAAQAGTENEPPQVAQDGTENEPPQAAQAAPSGIQLPDPSTRREAPDFTLQDVEGKDVRLSDYRGKVVLLKFWATWCAPCRMEVPDFINLQRDYRDRGVEVIAVSMDREGARVVAPFVRQHGINYRVAVDGSTVVNRLGGIPGVPTTFLLDRQGRIVGSLSGYNPPAVWKELTEAALAEG